VASENILTALTQFTCHGTNMEPPHQIMFYLPRTRTTMCGGQCCYKGMLVPR